MIIGILSTVKLTAIIEVVMDRMVDMDQVVVMVLEVDLDRVVDLDPVVDFHRVVDMDRVVYMDRVVDLGRGSGRIHQAQSEAEGLDQLANDHNAFREYTQLQSSWKVSFCNNSYLLQNIPKLFYLPT